MTGQVGIDELRFLVVEDHGFQRWALGNVLEGLGARHILAAADGRDALRILAQRGAVDIVISDLDMPEMDGMELIRRLGEGGGGSSLIVASGLERALVSSVEAMASAYGVRLLGTLEKPVDAARLQALIARHIADVNAAGSQQAVAREFSVDEIVAGMERSQFEPFFQAKVDMGTGAVLGAEALARWRHPAEGLVEPAAFIDTLERSGRIDDLTKLMVRGAATSCRLWRNLGFEAGLSLNLSQESLADLTLADRMTRLVTDEGLEPRDVIFEVTESAMAVHLGHALENLSRLRMRGFGLSIDDYGTGYSSMQQLARIAFTELKIDRAFVHNAAVARSGRAMLESSLEMAGKLHIPAVAEGVETREDWDLLRELGCDLAQGYFVSRPMAYGDFVDWLKMRRAVRG